MRALRYAIKLHLLCILCLLAGGLGGEGLIASAKAKPSGLPLPSSMPLNDYERKLYRWLMEQRYKKLDWARDEAVRDTGPYIRGQYYGTHPAVRIYYSPEIMAWLAAGRKGDIADGAMIIKEMYSPPAALYNELRQAKAYAGHPKRYEKTLGRLVTAWTVMIKDGQGSKDGWFWAGPGAPGKGESIAKAIERQLDDYSHALYSGFGLPCLRCHASAERESTFSDLVNILDLEPGQDPLRFRVDNSWRSEAYFAGYPLSLLRDDPYVKAHFMLPAVQRPWPEAPVTQVRQADFHFHMRRARPDAVAGQAGDPPLNPAFVETFHAMVPPPRKQVRIFPFQWSDHVVAGPEGAQQYITSDNCLGCHGGLGGDPYGVTMFIKTGPAYGQGYNISEFGEWRWSPMGLAGRDPIFHAQLESEMALLVRDAQIRPSPLKGTLKENQQAVTNTCLSCHGAMGQRQLQIDAGHDKKLDPNFRVEYFYLTEALKRSTPKPPDYIYHEYGELAREGISCTICHHIAPPDPKEVAGWKPPVPGWINKRTPKELAYFLFNDTTGHFETTPADELLGPYKQVAQVPMEHTLGITPKHDDYVSNSQLCGTCHTINLPNIGLTENRFPVLTDAEQNPALRPYFHTVEQATFLEWQNSAFAQPPKTPYADFKSCQDCHMPESFTSLDGSIKIDTLTSQIATIQDTSYPQAEQELPAKDIEVPLREGYKRHEHVGLNVFLLEMFNQFPDILGVDKTDFMTSATTGNALAIDNMLRQAREQTVDLTVKLESLKNDTLSASLTLTNKTGHRFPSGVAFRRAFVEFLVLEGDRVIWSSGRTNTVGVIVNDKGKPLKTEFLPGPNDYQRHHQVITRPDQVQIYEELNQNAYNEFTTSFIHRVKDIKDNRLLPKGWRESVHFKRQGAVICEFMQATDPHGVGDDPDYRDQGPGFPGQDRLQYKVKLDKPVDRGRLSVKATLYYQAIPPYWLHQRFSTAPDGEATKRLYYLASHLDLEGTAIQNWKLPLVSAVARLK